MPNRILFITLLLCIFLVPPLSAEEIADSPQAVSLAEEKPAETDLLSGEESHAEEETEKSLEEAEEDEEDMFDLEEEFGDPETKEVFDPLSGYNRGMTHVNDKLYYWVLKPVAKGYRFVMPKPARRSIVRFFNNLLFPVRFVNNVLQLKFKGAGVEFSRFCINSTVGILGFGDPAKKWFDLDPHPEDFGQTLGHYGVGSGFHIVLPLLGPSNLRDMAGLVPDFYLDPVTQIDDTEEQFAVRSLDKINYTSLHLGEYESLQKDAVDFYTFMRDAYEQNRDKKIEE